MNHQIKEIPHDSETIAYMLRLSLQSSKGMRERLVEQYMQLLDEESFLEMIEDDILTGHETSLITEIYPNYNFTLEPDGKKPNIKLSEDVSINVETANEWGTSLSSGKVLASQKHHNPKLSHTVIRYRSSDSWAGFINPSRLITAQFLG